MIESLYKPFRQWSEKGAVYIISDPHFDDPDTKKIDPEWPDADKLVNRLNKTVHKPDTLIILGDIGDKEYLKKLNGHIVLVLGNHDRGESWYSDACDEIYSGPLFISDRILLSHEPVYGLTCCVNIHGHDHNMEKRFSDIYHVNTACNVCGYEPLNLGVFLKSGAMKPIRNIHRQTIDKASNIIDNNKKRDYGKHLSISKNDFVECWGKIKEQQKKVERFNDALDVICCGTTVFDADNQYLAALTDILAVTLHDTESGWLDWWICNDGDYIVDDEVSGEEWNLETPEAFYDFMEQMYQESPEM